jgi:hypothetical protein
MHAPFLEFPVATRISDWGQSRLAANATSSLAIGFPTLPEGFIGCAIGLSGVLSFLWVPKECCTAPLIRAGQFPVSHSLYAAASRCASLLAPSCHARFLNGSTCKRYRIGSQPCRCRRHRIAGRVTRAPTGREKAKPQQSQNPYHSVAPSIGGSSDRAICG